MAPAGNTSPEQILALLQDAIENVPAFVPQKPLTSEEIRWLGRVDALIEASGAISAIASFRAARAKIGMYNFSLDGLLIPLHDVYSRM